MNNSKTSNIKICSDSEIHVIKLPTSLQTLKEIIPTIFLATLPQPFELTYHNSNNEKTLLNTEQDFQALNELSSSGKTKTIKVFVQLKSDAPKRPTFKLQDDYIESADSEYYHILESDSRISPIKIDSSDFPLLEKPADNIQEIMMLVSEPFVKDVEPDYNADFAANMAIFKEKMKEATDLMKELSPEKDSIAYYESHYELIPQSKAAFVSEILPKAEKKKPKKSTKPVCIEEKSLEDLVQKIIEKNLTKIAAMTSNAIKNKPAVSNEAPVVHKTVRCNGCRAFPMVGIRYKCTVCYDYDLCETCEGTRDHVHALIKIKYPGQPYRQGDRVKKERLPMPKAANIVKAAEIVRKEEEKPVEKEKEEADLSMKKARVIKKRVQFVAEPEVLPVVSEEKPKEVVEEKKEVENKEEGSMGSDWERPIVKKVPVKEERKKVYPVFVKTKARQLQQLLPEANFEKLLEFVEKSKENLDLVEMMEMFQMLQLE